jgi:hypothetical protein
LNQACKNGWSRVPVGSRELRQIMLENFNPIDSLVSKIKSQLGFLERTLLPEVGFFLVILISLVCILKFL